MICVKDLQLLRAKINLLAESLFCCPGLDSPQEQDGTVTLWGQEAPRLHVRGGGALSAPLHCMGPWGSVAARTAARLLCLTHSSGTWNSLTASGAIKQSAALVCSLDMRHVQGHWLGWTSASLPAAACPELSDVRRLRWLSPLQAKKAARDSVLKKEEKRLAKEKEKEEKAAERLAQKQAKVRSGQ